MAAPVRSTACDSVRAKAPFWLHRWASKLKEYPRFNFLSSVVGWEVSLLAGLAQQPYQAMLPSCTALGAIITARLRVFLVVMNVASCACQTACLLGLIHPATELDLEMTIACIQYTAEFVSGHLPLGKLDSLQLHHVCTLLGVYTGNYIFPVHRWLTIGMLSIHWSVVFYHLRYLVGLRSQTWRALDRLYRGTWIAFSILRCLALQRSTTLLAIDWLHNEATLGHVLVVGSLCGAFTYIDVSWVVQVMRRC